MKTVPLTEAKARLSQIIDQVVERDDEVAISRNGRPVAVLVSHDEFEGWKETIEIVSDTEFLQEIREGLRSLETSGLTYTLEDLIGPARP